MQDVLDEIHRCASLLAEAEYLVRDGDPALAVLVMEQADIHRKTACALLVKRIDPSEDEESIARRYIGRCLTEKRE